MNRTTLLSTTASLAATPRTIIFNTNTSTWADRPADTRPTIFVGGAAPDNVPGDTDLKEGDVWIPAATTSTALFPIAGMVDGGTPASASIGTLDGGTP